MKKKIIWIKLSRKAQK